MPQFHDDETVRHHDGRIGVIAKAHAAWVLVDFDGHREAVRVSALQHVLADDIDVLCHRLQRVDVTTPQRIGESASR